MGKTNATLQSTQKYLNILAIKDGIVIMKDGGLRLILKVGSLNFALKSEDEQTSMINQYQGFLNALKFDIQILMQSRRLDLFNYIRNLKEVALQQTNDMIRVQTEDYVNYIERLLTKANIMDKRFYVMVPFFPMGAAQKSWVDKILGGSKASLQFTPDQFKSYKEQLWERSNIVVQGLGSMGLKVETLSTQEIIELLYYIYNPDEAMNERMAEAGGLSTPVVSRAPSQVTSEETPNETKQASEAPGQPQTPPVMSPNAQRIPIGAEVSIGGQNFFATPDTLQSMNVEPVNPGAAPTVQTNQTAGEPMTKEKADAILGKVLEPAGPMDMMSAGEKLLKEQNVTNQPNSTGGNQNGNV